MSTFARPRPAPWNDRTVLLPKQMLYAVSLHLTAVANGPYLRIVGGEGGISHLLGDAMITTPEGLRCEVPSGHILGGEGEVGSAADPSSSALRLKINAELSPGGPLLLAATGVVSFNGGPGVFRAGPGRASALKGATFISTRHEAASPTYRWLNRRQLFGVGRVERDSTSDDLTLRFTFDLYAAA
jgi:hypothetical protein